MGKPLERILQSQGFGTRKACRHMVWDGRVTVCGELVEDPFQEFDPQGLVFTVDDETHRYREKAYLVLNKPSGVECSQKPKFHPSVYSLFPYYLRDQEIQTVGRLDEDTTGLLILTNDGGFIHTLTSPKKKLGKVYAVTLKHPMEQAQIDALLAGVVLNDSPEPVQAIACTMVSELVLHMTLTEGKYHQVKRMIGAIGNRVEALHRIRIGRFDLPSDLPVGEWRWLESDDIAALLTPDEALGEEA